MKKTNASKNTQQIVINKAMSTDLCSKVKDMLIHNQPPLFLG